jgi:RNA polymerase sigma factor (sigma-70 family)
MSNDIQALVGAAFGRLINTGVSIPEQDREDVLQAGYVGALEAAQRWVPEQGGFSTLITERARGAMLDYINTEARGGIGQGTGERAARSLLRHGEGDVTAIDELAGETAPLGDRQVYEWTPAGFDPEVEAEATMVRRMVEDIADPTERAMIAALFGINGPELSIVQVAEQMGVSRWTVLRRYDAALARLGYRDAVSPDGWADYRNEAFRRGAGATKAANPPRVAGRPYRRGRNNLWDPREARLTRASNRRAWLAAGRHANGRARAPNA